MAETQWPELGGKELRYLDQTWALTGDVAVRENGELLAARANSVDDVRHDAATLCFSLASDAGSLNPGNLGEHFDRIERDGDDHYLLVKRAGTTYRYALQRLERE